MSREFWTPQRLRTLSSMATEPLLVPISGDCMSPWLRDGMRVRVQAERIYRPGDVVVIRTADGRWLAHRVIGVFRKRRQWWWLTQADMADRPDQAVLRQWILGRIIGGDCAPQIACVPLTHRLRAVGRFLRFAALRLSRAAATVNRG